MRKINAKLNYPLKQFLKNVIVGSEGGIDMIEHKIRVSVRRTGNPGRGGSFVTKFFKGICRKIFSGTFLKNFIQKKQSVMKTYCWSCYLPGARFAADKIYLKENRFMVTFSDADMGELFEFFNAFQLMRNIEYPMEETR